MYAEESIEISPFLNYTKNDKTENQETLVKAVALGTLCSPDKFIDSNYGIYN